MNNKTAVQLQKQIETKTERLEGLKERAAEIGQEQNKANRAFAVSIAAGQRDTARETRAALSDEAAGHAQAIEMLRAEIGALEEEYKNAAITESKAAEVQLIAQWDKQAAALDSLLKSVYAEQLLQRFEELKATAEAAQAAEYATDHLRGHWRHSSNMSGNRPHANLSFVWRALIGYCTPNAAAEAANEKHNAFVAGRRRAA
jgi:vacuolar-type H+-ATPase subunit I/STV1